MIDWTKCPAVERVPGKVSGKWVFKGTRVPVCAFFENIQEGASIEDFVAWFPGITREQLTAVLRQASTGTMADLQDL